jgi:hypothetical protein
MKKYTLIALFLGFSFVGFFQTAKAQEFEKIQTEIPFEFSIGDDTFEAGKYTIYKIKSSYGTQLFQMVDKDNKSVKMFTARSDRDPLSKLKNDVSLTFKRYGEDRFLASINAYSNSFSLDLKESSVEFARQKKSRIKNSSVALPENI